MKRICLKYLLPGLLLSTPALADDLIEVRRLSMEMAVDIAQGAVEACRENGYQVTAVVVDRDGFDQMVMRDTLASRFTLQIAREKANAVILSGIDSSTFGKNRQDIREEMNHVDGILVLEGGVPIRAAGSLVGAVGVSGAPGGDKDAFCAKAGVAEVQERLDFAD
ncbi:GlcG/HbpS family heme-binding protein [Thiohalomonas denitrificans]|uniref:GlcG/HbpS family heme-binding protein n=1 Tax=Thiohalomonas denitrificans TaxID=415747 RepID=UPI0026F10E1E|nr:heme-binding protein [Thiohalomonas denitrificans]